MSTKGESWRPVFEAMLPTSRKQVQIREGETLLIQQLAQDAVNFLDVSLETLQISPTDASDRLTGVVGRIKSQSYCNIRKAFSSGTQA